MPKRVYPQKGVSATVTIDEAATQLGVTPDVLVEALVEYGLSESEARTARLLSSEVESYRAKVQRSRERIREQLEGLA